jgi:hypothetical protein
MTAKEIREAVDQGKTVLWLSEGYVVIKSKNDYLIKCVSNNHCIGLTWADDTTLNGDESEFFIKEQ